MEAYHHALAFIGLGDLAAVAAVTTAESLQGHMALSESLICMCPREILTTCITALCKGETQQDPLYKPGVHLSMLDDSALSRQKKPRQGWSLVLQAAEFS